MISRNYQESTQQYINQQDLIKYIDVLKSRIYEAFFGKSYLKVCQLQASLINAPASIFLATSQVSQAEMSQMNSFELGYLVFCLSSDFRVDMSYFCYYREHFTFDTVYAFQFLVEHAKCLLVTWCIKPYQDYLLCKKKLLYYRPHNIEILGRFLASSFNSYKYAICLNLKSIFSYFYLSALMSRLCLDESIRCYLLKHLNDSAFSYLIQCLDLSCDHTVFQGNNNGLFFLLLNTFISCICYELYTMLTAYFTLSSFKATVPLVHYDSIVLILCKDSLQAKAFSKELRDFLWFNGARLKQATHIHLSSLFVGINCNLLSIMTHKRAYPFHFAIRPSLYSQFTLMKQISLLLHHAAAQPLFLIIIRLNKLLLVWSDIYACQYMGRIFYLVDYLIRLKLKLFMKRQGSRLCSLSVSFLGLQCDNTLAKTEDLMSAITYSYYSYRHYISIRLFLIYQMKCLMN